MRIALLFMVISISANSKAQVATLPSGSGTKCDPYQIASLENLYWMYQNSSSWASNVYFKQTADIDATSTSSWNSGQGWLPVGNLSTRFYANYDGRGYTISNLYINQTGSGIGFFGFTQSGTIQNMHFDNVSFTATITGANGAGIISAYAYQSKFVNCSITNSTFNTSGSYTYAGTMFGRMSTITVLYCNSSATATHTYASAVHQPYGGLIGTLESGGTISYSYATGNVTKTGGGNRTGGFIGIIEQGTVSKCFASGNVSTANQGGGFVGNAYTCTIEDCYATGDVYSTASDGKGSFAGFMQSGSNVSRCYGSGALTGYSGGWSGGFSGYTTDGTFTNCFFDRETTGYTNAFGYANNNTGSPTAATTLEMTTLSTFTTAGWDFANVWQISGGVNSGYPTLIMNTYTLGPDVCNTWKGTNSTDWATASNWSNGVVPSGGDDIVIDPFAVRDLYLDMDRTIGTLFFYPSGKKVLLGENSLTATNFSGSDASNYVVTNGNGVLIRTLSNLASVQFPVGNDYYNPVTITNNSGASDVFKVRVLDSVFLGGLSGNLITTPHVKVTWDIHKNSANGGAGVDFLFQWLASQEQGTLDGYKLNHHNGTNWEFATGTSNTPSGSDLKTMSHTSYSGTFSPFAIGESGSGLPVELLQFSVSCGSGERDILWQTASEHNSSHFVVERRDTDGSWIYVGEKTAAGNSDQLIEYSLVDDRSHAGESYYRLIQYDLDGKYKIYGPVSSQCEGTMTEVKVVPNPTKDNCFIQVFSSEEKLTQFVVCNSLGQQIYMQEIQLTNGNNAIYFDLNEYDNGIYTFCLAGTVLTGKIVKH